MKAVLLDGYTINPGDLSWRSLEELCSGMRIYDRTDQEDVPERIEGAEVVFTSKCRITREVMEGSPSLRYVSCMATGYNNIDTEAAADLGIAVTNIPSYATDAVAQHTIALILELTNSAGLHSESVKKGEWASCEHFCYWKKPVTLLAGMSLGIIGYGAIGKRTAAIAEALGMKINIYSRDREAAVKSDIVTLHCPLTPENRKMVDEDFIKEMRPGSFLINTARGGLVDEDALAEALRSGYLRGAALDVLSKEPPAPDLPLAKLDNCIITPHIAWAPDEMRRRIIGILADNLRAWQRGDRLNRV